MARIVTPSSPKELVDLPFVEIGVKLSEVEKEYYKPGSAVHYQKNSGMSFIQLALMLSHFLKGASLVCGNIDTLSEIMRLVKRNQFGDAHDLFSKCQEGWVLKFPWTAAHSSESEEPWQKLSNVYGDSVSGAIKDVLEGCAGSVISEPWLSMMGTLSRNTIAITPVSGSSPVRLLCVEMDLWFPTIEQGVRIDGASRKITDISEGPLTLDGINNLNARNLGFYAGHTSISTRLINPKMTLAENLTFNMLLQYVAGKMQNIQFYANGDEFYKNIRSNLPLGAFFGQQVVTPAHDAPPLVLLHSNPGDLYKLLRDKFPGGRNLRQGGVFAHPSRAAKISGSAASLSLIGKNATTSRRKRGQGFLLYDRDTATTLKDALEVKDTAFVGHEMFEDYLDWYKEKRNLASRMTVRLGDPAPQWGKWGFNPWRFSELPENARLFIKIIKED